VYYISALAKHLETSKPGVTKRHKDYIKCLEATGVKTLMNRFKRKDMKCHHCKKTFYRHEEKETDVMLATTLFEQLYTDTCDTAVLVTGDTDLLPAVKTGCKLFPKKNISFAFPSGKKAKDLKKLAPKSFTLKVKAYRNHQFPDPVNLTDGSSIPKPSGW